MFSAEHHLAEISKTLARMADTGEKLVAAIDHLNASVQAFTAIVQGVLDHEKAMQDVITQLQDAAKNLPPDQSSAIEAAATAIDTSVATLKATIPAPAAPPGT